MVKVGCWFGVRYRTCPHVISIIRAKRVSNCYIPKKNLCVCRVSCVVCSTNLGFSVGYACVRLILVLVGKKCACVRLILVLV